MLLGGSADYSTNSINSLASWLELTNEIISYQVTPFLAPLTCLPANTLLVIRNPGAPISLL